MSQKTHNFVSTLVKLQDTDALPLTIGLLHRVGIAHDDWCDIYQRKPCHCDPDIYMSGTLPNGSQN